MDVSSSTDIKAEIDVPIKCEIKTEVKEEIKEEPTTWKLLLLLLWLLDYFVLSFKTHTFNYIRISGIKLSHAMFLNFLFSSEVVTFVDRRLWDSDCMVIWDFSRSWSVFVSCLEADATCDLIIEFSELQRFMFSSTEMERLGITKKFNCKKTDGTL